MKIQPPNIATRKPFGKWQRRLAAEFSLTSPACHALTLLEMLVSTAMLSLIILGLTAVFIQTQKAFLNGIKQATITDAGRTIADMIAADLRQMSDGQSPTITNLYWDWSNSTQIAQTEFLGGPVIRTNQFDEIYILVHTNNVWTGVGYAISNIAPGVGTLYRYSTNFNGPSLNTNNSFFLPFYNSITFQNFGTNWHRVADGVVQLKLRAYDQFGDETPNELSWGDYPPSSAAVPSFSYPYYAPPLIGPIVTTNLPASVELELGVLEPQSLGQLRSLPLPAQQAFIENAVSKEEIFRERISIPSFAR